MFQATNNPHPCAKLIESEARLKLSLETNQTGVWELNLEDDNIIRTATHDKIFGYQTPLPKFNLETFFDILDNLLRKNYKFHLNFIFKNY